MRRRTAFRRFSDSFLASLLLASLHFSLPSAAATFSDANSLESDVSVLQARINPIPVEVAVDDAADLRFAHLSTSQGLSQTRVQQIIQDDEGFLWFGTQYGVNRYDGYTFKVFAHDPTRSNSLGGVYIFSLFKDRSGYLWIGSDQSLDRFDPRTETFTHYHLLGAGSNQSASVRHINQDHEGAMWLSTAVGLFRLDPDTGNTTMFQHLSDDPFSLASSDIKSTFEDRNHRFWVAGRNGLDQLDRRTRRVTLHVPVSGPVREFLAYQDKAGLIWLVYASGAGAGLASYDPESNLLSNYTFASKDVLATAFTGGYAITQDREGSLWIGTGGMGLLKLDPTSKHFLRYRHVVGDAESIAEDHVTALLEDSQGNMWVGLHSKEPNYFPLRAGPFQNVLRVLGPHGGGESLVTTVFKARDGTLWAGTTNGLYRLDSNGGANTFYSTSRDGVSAGVVAITEDAEGNLWLGTVGQGLKRFDPRSGKIKAYLSGEMVAFLQFDGPDNLWVSTWDGLARFNTITGSLKVYHQAAHPAGSYGNLVEDRDKVLWIASDAGLVQFNPNTTRFTVFRHADGMPTISSNDITFLFIDSAGQLWVATRNGLSARNIDGTYTSYQERDGLGGNSVSCILEDGMGRLWLSTNKGLSRFDRMSKSFTNYSAADGLGDLTGWNSCTKTADGELLFAGFSGLVAFHPENVAESLSLAPIRFTDLRVFGQSVAISADSVLKKSISYTDAIVLSDKQRNFSLGFASLSFASPGSIRYRYKMEGMESQWTEGGSDGRVVSYSGLSPGSFTFRAQAAVGRGPWTEPGAVLKIQVLPPWWRSWWFTALLAAVMIGLVWAIYRLRLRSISRQFEIRLEERVNERTRIARELHDSLLQGFHGLLFRLQAIRELLPGNPSNAADALDNVLERSEESITDAREAVQDLRASSLIGGDLEHALAALAEEFGRPQRPFGVLVQGNARDLMPLARDDAYRIAREALRNAARHSNARKIEVELEYGPHEFSMRIRDDGDGIDAEVLARGRRAGHWGMQGMRERAKQLGGRLSVWSERGAGTEVELVLPARIAYGPAQGNLSIGAAD
jgi:signal transduction histidine kinase/ligand-binding sensor domain-containing protein